MPADNSASQAGVNEIHPADLETALKFLRFIFEGATGYAEFRFFGPGRKPKVAGSSHYVELPLDEDRVAEDVLGHALELAIAVGPAPRCRIPGRGRPGGDKDVLQVGCVWVNLDNSDAQGGAVEVIRRIQSFPLRPSVTVNSGYGYHLYFAFHSPLRAGRLPFWSDLMRDLRRCFYADERVGLAQTMRLPGTRNIKEPHPVPCEIWEENSSWTRYGTEEVRHAVEAALKGLTPRQNVAPGSSGGYTAVFSPDFLHSRGVGGELIKAVVTGRIAKGVGAVGYDAESGRDFRIALALYEKGLSEEEIKAVFRANPAGCGSNWAQKRQGEKYLEATLRKVRERFFDTRELSPAARGAGDVADDLSEPGLPPCYVRGEDGSVWFNPPVGDSDKKPSKPVKVCNSPLRIAAIHENIDTGQISLVIEFEYLGRTRSTSITRAQMSSARLLVTALSGEGAPVSTNNARHVLAYLGAYEHAFAAAIPLKKVTSNFGRRLDGGKFFFPGLFTSVEFAPAGAGDASLFRAYSSRQGSLAGWLKAMRVLAEKALLIPQVAVLASLVPPLQRRLQIPNFILDIHGDTSTGKSTTLKIAASVYGKPYDPDSLVLPWMNTQAAVEHVANTCSELPIFLDDAQHCPRELKRSVIYMIANGRGKGRSGLGRGILGAATWHTVALSTSEEPLHESSPHEGARGRILPLGGSVSPLPQGSDDLVRYLEKVVASNHGHAGATYIRHLNGWTDAEWFRWQSRYFGIRTDLLKNGSSNLLGRVNGYIAAVQLAAEVAGPLLGLPFSPEVVSTWLRLHLDERQSEQNLVLTALRALADHYVSNIHHIAGDGKYESRKGVTIYGASKRGVYVGFLRSTVEAVCKPHGWNVTALLSKLAEANALHATEADRHTKKVAVEGVHHRMVCFRWSALFSEED